MFRFKVKNEKTIFEEERFPFFLREIDEEILHLWREDGYRTQFGDVRLDSGTADVAYYYDVSRGSVHVRLVIGLKETDDTLIVSCNVAYYPKDTKRILLAASVAGILTGTLFYYYAIAPYVFTPLEIWTSWLLSSAGATAVNYLLIRYFHSRAKKLFRSGGRSKLKALALEREVLELTRKTLLEYGDLTA
jgi:hypothetical protein